MTVDLAALAKLASEATPGPWHSGSMIDPKQVYRYSPPNLIPDTEADAAYIAAASPDVVLALVRVALAAKAFCGDDYTWDREANGDPGPALTVALRELR